jgi:sulfatase-modifying factor enzyme 1/sulfatase-like protein
MDDYPSKKDFPKFIETFGPRGVIHSWVTDKDDPTEMPRWGKIGKQKIEDTGPLTTKRMETCDDDFVSAAKDFIKRQHDAGKPFFVWLNTTHMHFITHTKASSKGQAGRWQSNYHDTMIDHDKNVGDILDLLDELGIAEDTNKVKTCCTISVNPRVISPEYSYDVRQPQFKIPRKVVKGGSHICAPNYCLRYRPAARQPQMIDTGMTHIGFRCIIRTVQ